MARTRSPENRKGAPGRWMPAPPDTNSPKSGVKTSGASTAASDDSEAITPCTMPCRSASTVSAEMAVSVGGTRSVSAANTSRTTTIQSASARPKPAKASTESASPASRRRTSPSRATPKGMTPACTVATRMP